MITVLISSAGRRVELVKCFREDARRLGVQLRLVATDAAPELSSACAEADASFKVPRCSEPGFVDEVLRICRDESVSLLVPTIDPELLPLSRRRAAFTAIGTTVAVSDPDVIALCQDKLRCTAALTAAGIPTPQTLSLADYLSDPTRLPGLVIAKPNAGSASVGVLRVSDPSELARLGPRPDLIIQEYCPSDEFTVNVFLDAAGKVITAVPHRRIEVRNGEVSKGQTERMPALRRIAEQLAQVLPGARGQLCFQAMQRSDGTWAVIEINPRFGGGYPLAHAAGARFSQWLLEEVTGMKNSGNDAWIEGVTMLRYDAAYFRVGAHVNTDRKRVVIVGAGGFGREIASWLKQAEDHARKWTVKGFLDDNPDALQGRDLGLPIVGSFHDYVPEPGDIFICGFGQPRLRRECHESLTRRGGQFLTLVHPTAVLGDGVKLGPGVIICPHTVISTNAQIGEGTAIYYHSSIDHDAVVGKWCQISAHCDVTGATVLGDGVFLGSHASILPGVTVGDRAIVGAGAVCTNDVPAETTVVGVPARPIVRTAR